MLRVDASPWLVLIGGVGSGLTLGFGLYGFLGLHFALGLGIATMFLVAVALAWLLNRRLSRRRRELEEQYFDGLPAAPVADLCGPGLLGGSDHGFLLVGKGFVFLGTRGTRLAIEPPSIRDIRVPRLGNKNWTRLDVYLADGNRLVLMMNPQQAVVFQEYAQVLMKEPAGAPEPTEAP